jgi:hypothetical protein
MREVMVLIGAEGEVLWRDVGQSPVALPDSRERWEAIWSRRNEIVEIAHSHPVGPHAFSLEDETTMAALLAALGRPILFSVVAPRGMIRRENGVDRLVEVEPTWAAELRRDSGMEKEQGT